MIKHALLPTPTLLIHPEKVRTSEGIFANLEKQWKSIMLLHVSTALFTCTIITVLDSPSSQCLLLTESNRGLYILQWRSLLNTVTKYRFKRILCFQFFAIYDYCFLTNVIIAITTVFWAYTG